MKKLRRGLDFWQNTVIALLTVSAVLLFSRTELFRLAWEETPGNLFAIPQDVLSVEEAPPAAPSLSVLARLSVSSRGGRRASISLTTDSGAFPRRLLARALAADPEEIRDAEIRPADSAENGGFVDSRRADFLRALDGTSIYCDFLRPLSLDLLTGLAGAPGSDIPETGEGARCTVLAEEGDAVVLYLWDGGEGYFRRETGISIKELEAAAAQEGLQSAFFAMDRIAVEKGCQNVAPLSLLLEETPSLPTLSVLSGVSDADRLLAALHFNPRTHSHYTEPNGTEVIMEDGRSVRIRANGSVYYQSGGRPEFTIDCAGDRPTDWEAAVGCAALLDAMASQDGGVCLTEIIRENDRMILRFGYHWNGVPVYLSANENAAAVVLEGNAIASVELLPRRFFPMEESSLLLPRVQALGVAGMRPGAELSIGYAVSGTRAYARWISG